MIDGVAVSTRSTVLTATSAATVALPFGILMVLALAIGFQPIPQDPDLWFHLASGNHILEFAAVPDTDPFSFTRYAQPWVPHSWLFDVGVAGCWGLLGPRGTEALFACLFALTLAIAFYIFTRQGAAPLVSAAVCLLLALAAANSRGPRPQSLSLLLCMVIIAMLTRQRSAPARRFVFILPLVFLLWAQVHAACVVGLLIVAIWFAGRTVEVIASGGWPTHRVEIRRLAVALALSLLAVLITPHRMSHFAYVWLTQGLESLRHTHEWQAPQPLGWSVPDVYAYVLMGGVIIALARSRQRVGWAQICVCMALLLLALSAVRHIPLACVAAVPLLASALGGGTRAVPPFPALRSGAPPLGIAVLIALAILWNHPTTTQQRYAAIEPVAGARALARLAGEWRVFTTYNTGGYVLNQAPGRLRVFIDSRADVYGDALFGEMRQAQLGRGWEALFARWNINAVVIERGDPLVDILRDHLDWHLLAEDPAAVTFIRADSLPQVCMSSMNRVAHPFRGGEAMMAV